MRRGVLQNVDVAHASGPRVMIVNGVHAFTELDEARAGQPEAPFRRLYGSVAAPTETLSRCHVGRASPSRNTATFTFTRIERP